MGARFGFEPGTHDKHTNNLRAEKKDLQDTLQAASARVALAAYLHDLGKFAERARVYANHPDFPVHLQLYCPWHEQGGWFSHQHAAHTALAFTELEVHFPRIAEGDISPFGGISQASDGAVDDPVDSLVNAAAAHHKPASFLQWVIATADRVASGFEREEFETYNNAAEKRASGLNHYTSRQLTLFEQVGRGVPAEGELSQRYPLTVFSPRGIFPAAASACEGRDNHRAQNEYRALWDAFVGALPEIPLSHRENLPLWLDHFDSLWLMFTHAIPSATAFGVRPEVSLYDHSRTTAALAVALWRWHAAHAQTDQAAAQRLRTRADFATEKFLLIQGDFFGIQDFVFAGGGESRKQAAKLLRGRSFQVALFTELAALKILDALALPPTSVVTNAAGKFLLVAPNTADCVARLEALRTEFDQWFAQHTFGLAGVGLAWTAATSEDFLRKDASPGAISPFARLAQRLRDALERAKYQRFGLCATGATVFTGAEFPLGPCLVNGRLPADRKDDGIATCALSRDQVKIGECLVKFDRLLIVAPTAAGQLHDYSGMRTLEMSVFGYQIAFTRGQDVTGSFGQLARTGGLRRCIDFSLPAATDDSNGALWHGVARRFISGYVPRVSETDRGGGAGRYDGLITEEIPGQGELKTLDMLACEDRQPEPDSTRWRGSAALGVLKGDIDDLGDLFRLGLAQPTFAKMAALSRQVNAFFAVYLPWLLAREFPNVYTVFAGGADFFLIGPWRSVQRLAACLREEFHRYVAGNDRIHFSAGIATCKAGAPIQHFTALAEEALTAAKALPGKAAVTCFGETLPWTTWPELERALVRLERVTTDAALSRGFVYGLHALIDLRQAELAGKPEGAMWRARLAYRTKRFIADRDRGGEPDAQRRRAAEIRADIGGAGIEALGTAYRVVLFNHLYMRRDN